MGGRIAGSFLRSLIPGGPELSQVDSTRNARDRAVGMDSTIRTDRMSNSIQDIVRQLVTKGLVKPGQAEEVVATEPSSVDQFLQTMERKQYLTSYQSNRVRKGEADQLTLGRYKLLYRNASGSFARVFRAASLIDDSMVALKLLRSRWANDPDTVKSFRREAEVCKQFLHPNIVPIYDVGSEGDRHYFTMEFVEGGNLRDFIRIRKKLSPVEGARCLIDICSGLDYTLGLGYTHRDLKMTNVLMSSQGVAKLVDFGLAGEDSFADQLGGGEAEQRALEYAALEKGSNAPRSDHRSDIFFAGAIFYELITGEPAWPRTKDREERKQFSRYVNVRPIRQVDPSIPLPITKVITQMMEVSPSSRYQTPGEVVMALKSALEEIGDSESRPKAAAAAPVATAKPTKSETPTILCVEDRKKHQKVLREYFTERGFKLLLMTDQSRAFARLKSATPPDVLVLMGKTFEKEIVDVVADAESAERDSGIPVLTVISKELAAQLEQEQPIVDWRRLLIHPLNLKQLRMSIDKALNSRA